MKTGKELILDLPNGVRRNFILQLAKEDGYEKGTEFLNQTFPNLRIVLQSGIVWHSSVKGYKYWKKIQSNA